jgi:hypothetical protein
VVNGKPESVFRHEMVHVVQSLQLMAASPEPFLKGHRREDGKAAVVLQRLPRPRWAWSTT